MARLVAPDRFTLVADDVAGGARFLAVRWLPRGVAGITLGRTVLLRADRWDDGALVAHELVHVEQWAALGTRRFVLRYVRDYLRGLVATRRHRDAYRAIPFEREARARAALFVAGGGPGRGSGPLPPVTPPR